jgi:hypothetical protein
MESLGFGQQVGLVGFGCIFQVIVWTHYGINESGLKPDDDLHLRLTFYVNFEQASR